MINLEKLKNLRLKYKLSCRDMAKILKMSAVYYWQLEAGKRVISYVTAIRIAKVFNKKPDEIFYSGII